jgi:osmotically-inducible protein OsmY
MGEGEAVVLRGVVGSDRERALAEAVARLTPGVFNIRNELEVKPPE